MNIKYNSTGGKKIVNYYENKDWVDSAWKLKFIL